MHTQNQPPAFLQKIHPRDDLAAALQALPRPWVFTNGVFDVLHRGHVVYLAQARALLRNQPERRPEDARLKLAAEAQLLRDMKAWQQAFEVYGEAVARFPDDGDLLYDQATMAEKAGQPEVMEQLLRRLIALKPDYHHAYNALGYSLADRNIRLAEAHRMQFLANLQAVLDQ